MPLVMFEGIMNSEFYQEILATSLIPFIQEQFPESHRLMQDNDPKHVSKSTVNWMQERGINWWKTPPESPDLNPIENVWAAMKMYLRKTIKPTNKQELIAGTSEFWSKLTVDTCNRFMNHIDRVIPVVIAID